MTNLILYDTSVIAHQISYGFIVHNGSFEKIHDRAEEVKVIGEVAAKAMSNLCWLPPLENQRNKILWLLDVKPYWRTSIFPEYKAQRRKHKTQAAANTSQLKAFCNQLVLEGMSRCEDFVSYGVPGYEADDLAGFIVKEFQASPKAKIKKIYLCTIDSDWQGLISPEKDVIFIDVRSHEPRVRGRVEAYSWLSSKWNQQSKKRQKWWSMPSFQDFQARDIWTWKSVVGDRSDNLPPGTALNLIDLLAPPTHKDLSARHQEKRTMFHKINQAPIADPAKGEAALMLLNSFGYPPPVLPLARIHPDYL